MWYGVGLVEALSDQEARFEARRQKIGLVLGPLCFLVLWILPLEGLSPQAHRLAAILGLVLVFWLTEAIPIPVTALLGPVLCVLLGVASAQEALAPFAHPIIFLFIGSFMLARAMALHHLDRRFALALFALPAVRGNTGRLFLACGGAAALLSMWISNTAATAILLPIALGILEAMNDLARQSGEPIPSLTRRGGWATGVMLMIAYGASIGGIGTPVGTPPNLIGIGMLETMAGHSISFLQWMLFALPLVAMMFGVLALLLTWLHPPPIREVAGAREHLHRLRQELGPWTREQWGTLLAFLTAVVLWVTPGGIALFLGTDAPLYQAFKQHFNVGISALLAASLLFLIPARTTPRRGLLTWREAVQIDWGTILLFGGGLSLGKLLFDTGLARVLGEALQQWMGVESVWSITALAIAFGILISETTSNTASANMVVPVMIALAQALQVSPIPPALGATLGASYGFMLPVSTPPNAIAYGSGLVPIQAMIRAGILFDLLGGLTIWIGLRILCPLFGWV